LGYEHVDPAAGSATGAGGARGLVWRGRARASYFITSKIPGGLNASAAAAALDANLAALRLSHVDLMLVHFPATWGGEGGKAARQAEWRG
jgi:diketogulonate reductase-like aldo/keto reductase